MERKINSIFCLISLLFLSSYAVNWKDEFFRRWATAFNKIWWFYLLTLVFLLSSSFILLCTSLQLNEIAWNYSSKSTEQKKRNCICLSKASNKKLYFHKAEQRVCFISSSSAMLKFFTFAAVALSLFRCIGGKWIVFRKSFLIKKLYSIFLPMIDNCKLISTLPLS